MKKYFFLIMLTTFSMLLIGCTSSSPTCSPNDTETCTLPFSGESLKDTADHVLQLIKANDFPTLSTFVGPAGVRFSPYEYVNLTGDVVFTSGQLYHALAFSRLFQRGSYDGS